MTLSDKMAYRQIVGCLMHNPLLFIEYEDIDPMDFDNKIARLCFIIIKNLYNEGAIKITPIEVDQEIEKHPNSANIYQKDNGLDFLKTSYEFAEINNFGLYYNRLKKYSLLRRLVKEGYDVSDFYIADKDIVNPLDEVVKQEAFDNASIEDILNSVESKYNLIRNEFLKGGRSKSDPANGIMELIDNLQKTPNVGPSLEGKIFSSACRGARSGTFYLKTAGAGTGKTRSSIYDACHLCYPIKWSHEKQSFIVELDINKKLRESRKVLFIVTEMGQEELQTIMLSYLSGVNESHILTNKYKFGEYQRVIFAANIMKKFSGNFIIEEISEPNLVNVSATIKKYATIDKVKYVFFDYIHSTASLFTGFSKNGVREDVLLMLMANQLKQLAKDYDLFVMSATQTNATGMGDEEEFKDMTSIRGAKSIADKCDIGFVISRINPKVLNSLLVEWRKMVRLGYLDAKYVDDLDYQPTHVLDIYKNRRGMYKNIRIWTRIDLGTGQRKDLFITDMNNQPLEEPINLFTSSYEEAFDWRNYFDENRDIK